jgi:hypothetical protein
MSPTVKSWRPTKKWLVTQITAASALALMWVTTGSWDQEETVGLIGLLTQAALGYLQPNEDTPGGVPRDPAY